MPPFERRLFSLTRIFTTPIPAPAKKTLFRPGKHLVRHRVVDFETPDNNFSQLPTDKTKIELRPAFPRPTEEPHIPANTRPSAVRTTDDPETLRINSLPPKNKKVANEYRLQPSRPPGRLRRERDSNPRSLAAQRFSRPPQSTTLPSLRVQKYNGFSILPNLSSG